MRELQPGSQGFLYCSARMMTSFINMGTTFEMIIIRLYRERFKDQRNQLYFDSLSNSAIGPSEAGQSPGQHFDLLVHIFLTVLMMDKEDNWYIDVHIFALVLYTLHERVLLNRR